MTTIDTGPSWVERLNPRSWSLTWKLVVVGLVPALLALALGALRVSDQAAVAAEQGESSQRIAVHEQVAEAADALRQERDEATLFAAGGRTGNRDVLNIGSGQSDAEVGEMLTSVAGVEGLEDSTRSALALAKISVGQLQAMRSGVVADPASDITAVRTAYDKVVNAIDVLDRALLREVRTPGAGGLIDAMTAATGAEEQLALQHTVLGAAILSGKLLPADATTVSGTDSRIAEDFREYQVSLVPEQLYRFGNFLNDPASVKREQLKQAIVATPPNARVTVPAAEWDAAYNGSRSAVGRSTQQVQGELVNISAAAEQRASNEAGINSVILMLGLLIGIAIAILVARSLIRSLRVLRTSALDVAERRLPQAVDRMRAGETPDVAVDPVPITARDEVGQVARAFDAVHGQAVRLAADQAALQQNVSAMFVNLSRRSQALVERQLQLIEQLESNEQDADQLSNLFQLDHLATRMRRNSENLLVLAGTDLAKRNIAPVPMVDVLRAAVSEIEQYQRIVVQSPPNVTVAGRAASDLVHLLAELLDNATNFSPPDSQVVMSSTRTPEGDIVVEIADLGVGMADHELSDANQRLSGPSTVDVSASRRMGLFVVGRLGTRHGVAVQLSTSMAGGPGGGLTASVTVPVELIPSGEPVQPALEPERREPSVVPAGGGVPPQRAGQNGSGHPGSLSAFVAGTDGPANPIGVFEQGGQDDSLFGAPPATNGTGPAPLPTRRPGSTLRPGGPPLPPERGGPSGEEADRAREIAEQAKRDQEEAAKRAVEPAGETAEPTRDTESADGSESAAPERNGTTPHGTNGTAAGLLGVAGVAGAAAAAGLAGGRKDGDDEAGEPAAEDDPPARPSGQGVGPVAHPTTPMPFVEGGEQGPRPRPRPSPQPVERRRPDEEEQAAPAEPLRGAPAVAAESDGLFAPSVPSIDERAAAPADDDLGETTPIFQEIASAWFRSNRPIPVSWEQGNGQDGGQQGNGQQGNGRSTTATAPAPGLDTPLPEPLRQEPAGATSGSESEFANAADEGWRAASVVTERPDELTAAGLPKRRPRARLVPGSAGSAVLAPNVSPARSAESIRGRLASYQQGVRQGRESRGNRESQAETTSSNGGSEPAGAGGLQDEENS